ncbi:hypothetical protein RJ639_027097, partial [Escallonia herrerae]
MGTGIAFHQSVLGQTYGIQPDIPDCPTITKWKAKGNGDKDLKSQNKLKVALSGKPQHKEADTIHASKGTWQEWAEGADASQHFTMDYSHVRRRRPIHNKSVPKAKTLAEEAAKRSQTLTLTTSASPAKLADVFSETARLSNHLAAEASRKADELRAAADHRIKSLAGQIPSLSLAPDSAPPIELEELGITDDLREFVKGLTVATFQNFPVQDDLPESDVAEMSNVRQDLSEWQQKHATLVLTTVKEISRLRYELCPRHMKDSRFWRIYFTLVSSHVAQYERNYIEEIKIKSQKIKDGEVKQSPAVGVTKSELVGTTLKSKASTSSVEQDIDTFLLGDLEDSDGGPDDDENFDDDFDKIGSL